MCHLQTTNKSGVYKHHPIVHLSRSELSDPSLYFTKRAIRDHSDLACRQLQLHANTRNMSDGSSATRRPPPPPSLAREERTPPTTLLKQLLADVAVANNNALAGPASDQLKLAECLHAVAWQSAETLIELGGLACVIALVRDAESPSVRAEALAAVWNLTATTDGAKEIVGVGLLPVLAKVLVSADADATAAIKQAAAKLGLDQQATKE